jgi:adenylosuccinate synthase
VGNGPFPTEDDGAEGEALRRLGNEYGTTTGRPRRCGWFDAVAARTVVKLNGITEIALTKLDVLDAFEEIKVCTSYKLGNKTLDYFPIDTSLLERCRPQYETMAGWRVPTGGLSASTLPAAVTGYIRRLESLVGCRVSYASVGPERGAIYTIPARPTAAENIGDGQTGATP